MIPAMTINRMYSLKNKKMISEAFEPTTFRIAISLRRRFVEAVATA